MPCRVDEGPGLIPVRPFPLTRADSSRPSSSGPARHKTAPCWPRTGPRRRTRSAACGSSRSPRCGRYGFRDKHVNDVLEEAANARTIRLFVVDPNGMDAMDMWRHAHIPGSQSFRNSLWSVLHGCSRRSLDATFSRDAVEHSKLMRFITD